MSYILVKNETRVILKLTACNILKKAIGTKYEYIKSLGKYLGNISSCECIEDTNLQLCVAAISDSHFNRALPISITVESCSRQTD